MTKIFFIFSTILSYFIQPFSVKDFEPAFGKWKGTLTCLVYTSGKPFEMPANMNISVTKQIHNNWFFQFNIPMNQNQTTHCLSAQAEQCWIGQKLFQK